MAKSRRQARLNELLLEEIGSLIHRDIQDPRVNGVSVSGVEVSPDLARARVFVILPGGDKARRQALAGLEHAAGFLRHELAERLSLHRLPDLTFEIDRGFEQGLRIDALFEALRRHEEPS